MIDFNSPDGVKTAGGDLEAAGLSLTAGIALAPIAALEDVKQAVRERQAIPQFQRRVAEYFAPLKSTAYRLHKMLCDREREILDPLERVDRAKQALIRDYKAAEDRARRERERAAAEQARHEAEAR